MTDKEREAFKAWHRQHGDNTQGIAWVNAMLWKAWQARASLSLPAAGQEPVAWRTFDGEGGYDYRTYDDNENYRAEWEQRNPNHKGWVEPLYAAPQPAVAAGWVMVPADPTLDMGWAYLDAARESEPFKTHSFNRDGYRAMLKAAPLPPAPSTEGEKA
jgi:hypothetical protein